MRGAGRAVVSAVVVVALPLGAAGPAGAETPVFQPATSYPTGPDPEGVASADFDQDGNVDLVVANSDISGPGEGTAGTVAILRGLGDGTFAPRVEMAAGVEPHAVAVGDLNHDGDPDLAVANADSHTFGAGSVSILLGRAGASFAPAVEVIAGGNPFGVAMKDFDHDGQLDLAVSHRFGGYLSVRRGLGDGTFGPPATIATENPDELVARDLNGDGDADLVVGPGLSQGVKVLIGGPGAMFGPPVTYRVRGGVTSLAVGDLNHDGHRDIVTAEFAPDGLSILLGRGDGTFAPYYGYVLNNGAFGVAISDVNLDRNPDLLVGIPGVPKNKIKGFLGSGDGTFAKVLSVPMPGPGELVARDLNHDGAPDLAAVNVAFDNVSVALQA